VRLIVRRLTFQKKIRLNITILECVPAARHSRSLS
jgi:hypothetical protein